MTEKRVITFSMVSAFFSANNAQLERGENSYSSGNVIRMSFDPSVTPALLKGEVKASMKGRKYCVELFVDPEDGITDAKCTCPRGQVICHHMAALCIHAHHNVSVTDKACAWNAPKSSKMEETKSLNEMFPPKKPNYCAVSRKATTAEVTDFKKRLNSHVVGFTWLLQAEPEETLLFENKIEYFKQKCALSQEKIKQIAEATCGQSSNENWLIARKYRLTASHFGAVIASCKRNRFPKSLYDNLLEGYNLNSVLAIQWGRENELSAIETFKAATGMEVFSTGLWLEECGYIGASPDGFVGEDALIEVKCPYKYKSVSLEDALRNDKTYIIYKNEEGDITVNTKHVYWDQIQGQLHITNKEKCFLVVWTPAECEIVEIPKYKEWEENMDLLKQFYLEKFIPYITNMKA
ncbi:hypothetical protein NQ314_004250 [Rhamnusium bicolor]|uniref:SWIM-type domain-containing protein n=1 Tax=Rhamnusium bicolor TaxID=1586634 RepID=A0AAV8ZK31_9CUCU|nr:hypothetical protein NQ314_004250 [Rhamnusium bicolor]